jgi:uncharacterized protein YdbL (DUF1318 family)
MRQLFRVLMVLCLLAFGACVTINIYFPAEQVESVAEDIVDDIRGKQSDDQKEAEDDGQSLVRSGSLLAGLLPEAYAQDATTVSNPTIRALKNRMKNRYAQLKPWYEQNLLIEKDDGYLATAGLNGVNIKDRRAIQSLVDAENKDRKQLYQEVAKAMNIDPSQVDRVAKIFAKQWQTQ